jgi:hypothetical protein
MSNLGFELWWAGGTTTLLTTQPQVGSRAAGNLYYLPYRIYAGFEPVALIIVV